MRRIRLATFLCLGVWSSTVWSAQPDRQAVTEQQQQLIVAQQADDKQREPIQLLMDKNESLQKDYGAITGLRVVSDRLTLLNRLRDTRAARYWELMDLTVPLQQPLSDSRLAELNAFIGGFKDVPQSQTALAVLEEHKQLVSAGIARDLQAKLQLKTTTEELSVEQVDGLEEIVKKYATTVSAVVARQYLRAHFSRRLWKDVGNAGLLAPDSTLELSNQRLTVALQEFKSNRDKFLYRQYLIEIVEDYPGKAVAQQANAQLSDVQKSLNAEAEQTRSIREYWDAAYPSRISKPVVAR